MSDLTFDPNSSAFAKGVLTEGPPVPWFKEAGSNSPFPSSVAAPTELEILDVRGDWVLARDRTRNLAGWLPLDRVHLLGAVLAETRAPVLVRTYKGTQESAGKAFQRDAAEFASQGYYPASQSWAAGSYSCAQFLGALLLVILLVGLILLVAMLFVKPPGVLSVTYELRRRELTADQAAFLRGDRPSARIESRATRRCPRCAEDVLADAKVCRFCGHEFGG